MTSPASSPAASPAASPALELSDIHFEYRKNSPILRGVTASFPPGQITALLGNNGSGKTTLLKLLVGIHPVASGTLRLGSEIKTGEALESYKRSMGFMPESLQLYPEMKARDALSFFAKLKGVNDTDLDPILERVGLGAYKNQRIRTFSKGMKQRLNLAQAILGRPQVVVFDEPSNGFDASGVTIFYQTIRELADEGVIVILTTHLLGEIQGQVDRVALLSDGVIQREGSLESILRQVSSSRKRVWIQFDGTFDLSSLDWPPCPERHLHPLDSDSLTGSLDAREIGELISTAKASGLQLTNLRIEGSELADLLTEES